MLNKTLFCTTLACVLSFSHIAHANNASTFYLGADGGYANTHQNGLHVIDENTSVPGIVSTASNSNSTDGIAGRIYAGLQLDPYWGLELGYTAFSDATAQQNNHDSLTDDFGTNITEDYSAKLKTESSMVDLVIKGTLPIQYGLSIFAKAGLAAVYEKQTINMQDTLTESNVYGDSYTASNPASASRNETRLLPTISLGMQYNITKQLIADITWQRVQKTGNTNIVQSIDFASAGLSYLFN